MNIIFVNLGQIILRINFGEFRCQIYIVITLSDRRMEPAM